MIFRRAVDTPVGRVVVEEQDQAVVGLTWGHNPADDDSPLLNEAVFQLGAYFSGDLQQFNLPLRYSCSPFQQRVCEAMLEIPYGSTTTYGELAQSLQSAAQPVGSACGANPIAVIVPCHRVLGSRDIGGYSGGGGIETKIALLRLENAIPWLI